MEISIDLLLHLYLFTSHFALNMSYANTPKAATMTPAPIRLHIVIVSIAPPNITSENKTRTMVSKLPTDVITGPQIPRSIYGSGEGIQLEYLEEQNKCHTMNPALNMTPEIAMPAIVTNVIASLGNAKGS